MNLVAYLQAGAYREVMEEAYRLATPEAALIGAQAAIESGEFLQAEAFLKPEELFIDPLHRAERWALLGGLQYYQGNLARYAQMARQAVEMAPSFLTLYHQSRSVSPGHGIAILQEALALARNTYEQGRARMALARSLARLGRFRDALPYATDAVRNVTAPHYLLSWYEIAFYADDQPATRQLLEGLEPYLGHPLVSVRNHAQLLVATIHAAEGDYERARLSFEAAVSLITPNQIPFFALAGVLIYRGLGLNDQLFRLVQATQAVADLSGLHSGLAALVRGMARYPQGRAMGALEEAQQLLEPESPLEALKAATWLARLNGAELPPAYSGLLGQWSERGRAIFPPPHIPVAPRLRLQAMGTARFTSGDQSLSLRPRTFELLVLLLAYPQGQDSVILAQRLYGESASRPLHTELARLRAVLGQRLLSRPWRIEPPIEADFTELAGHLKAGQLELAVQCYLGDLLPGSWSPGIEELRAQLATGLREAALQEGHPERLRQLAERWPDDLELWEALADRLEPQDALWPVARARIQRLRHEYGCYISG
jgi:tetratricopeptide (TPR) repeat protein